MVTFCLVCGGWGFSEALEYCQKCQIYAVHRYCLDKLPSFKEDVVWFCEDCEPRPISDVPMANLSSQRLKKKSCDRKLKRTELAEKLYANKKNKSMEDKPSLFSKSELERQSSPLLKIKEVNCSENHENDEKLRVNLEVDGGCSDKEATSIEIKASLSTESELERQDSPLLEIKEVNCNENHYKDEKMEVNLKVDGGCSNQEAVSIEIKASLSTESELERQNTPLLEIKEVKCGENQDNDEKLEVNLEVDGRCSDKEEATSIQAKDPTAVAVSHSVIPEDCYIPEQRVSDSVKCVGGAESFKIKTSLLEVDDHSNNSGDNSFHHGWRENDGGCPNEKAKSVNIQTSFVAANDHLPEHGYYSAQPVMEPIWMGSFHLQDKDFGTVEGLVAHLSCLACSKVCEAAKTLPVMLFLELLPISCMWPKGFQKWGPSDHSIALYFFPDNERTEKIFDNLVDKMMSQNLGMKVILDNAELLIFTSSILPLYLKRFQAKYYLWGVFRGKQPLAKADPAVVKDHMDASARHSQSPVSPLKQQYGASIS
ncbi:hypothetical protein SLE2022_329970 [Rubroshorea leprosula]